jgi:hypothetical protein
MSFLFDNHNLRPRCHFRYNDPFYRTLILQRDNKKSKQEKIQNRKNRLIAVFIYRMAYCLPLSTKEHSPTLTVELFGSIL